MEIPYTVKNRPDTGVYNGKLGIWLFLASEVMLFGGLFAAYVFLRLGAPEGTWPNGLMNIWAGFGNSIILLLSSVFVTKTWASVKLNDFSGFKRNLAITMLLSTLFLGIKGYEYNEKFHHFGAFMKDPASPVGWSLQVTGHLLENPDKEDTQHLLLAADAYQPSDWASAPKPDNYHEIKENPALRFAHPGIEITGEEHHGEPVLKIAKDQIFRSSTFVPKYNSFFAIYFTMSGLHALHMIGGLVIFFYFWTFGSKMFHTNRAQFANRIEVTGLFWHFVDLIWFFLFPVMYLM
ncbi:MAG: cytochrome c oxidase subunit 3 [Candidatus Methylacidiphilales bacterium]|nr:cytochrome c oxidase subunit 3 [Candidatus Methylacidiphilales bacterium]